MWIWKFKDLTHEDLSGGGLGLSNNLLPCGD